MAEFSYPNINAVEIDDDVVKEYVQANYSPEDVFPENELRDWAESNGFIQED